MYDKYNKTDKKISEKIVAELNEFYIPEHEAWCSAEFTQGCIVDDEQED